MRISWDAGETPHVVCSAWLFVENGITYCAQRARFLAPTHCAAADTEDVHERMTVSRVLERSVFKDAMAAPRARARARTQKKSEVQCLRVP